VRGMEESKEARWKNAAARGEQQMTTLSLRSWSQSLSVPVAVSPSSIQSTSSRGRTGGDGDVMRCDVLRDEKCDMCCMIVDGDSA
jgi:hypothetical protein